MLQVKFAASFRVVARELAAEEQSILRLLTHQADEAETVRFIQHIERVADPGDRHNARAALEVIAAANLAMFERIGREANMEKVMKAIFADEWDRRWNEALEQGRQETRKEYEAVLADRDRLLADQDRVLADKERELEEMARQLRELKVQYGLA